LFHAEGAEVLRGERRDLNYFFYEIFSLRSLASLRSLRETKKNRTQREYPDSAEFFKEE